MKVNRINNPNLGKIIQFLEQRLEGEETKLITEEHNQVKKLKQQRNEEKKNYMKKCFFDHLKGKEVFMARARLQEKEEETEIKIFNEHKDRIKKLMAQKQMVSFDV